MIRCTGPHRAFVCPLSRSRFKRPVMISGRHLQPLPSLSRILKTTEVLPALAPRTFGMQGGPESREVGFEFLARQFRSKSCRFGRLGFELVSISVRLWGYYDRRQSRSKEAKKKPIAASSFAYVRAIIAADQACGHNSHVPCQEQLHSSLSSLKSQQHSYSKSYA